MTVINSDITISTHCTHLEITAVLMRGLTEVTESGPCVNSRPSHYNIRILLMFTYPYLSTEVLLSAACSVLALRDSKHAFVTFCFTPSSAILLRRPPTGAEGVLRFTELQNCHVTFFTILMATVAGWEIKRMVSSKPTGWQDHSGNTSRKMFPEVCQLVKRCPQ